MHARIVMMCLFGKARVVMHFGADMFWEMRKTICAASRIAAGAATAAAGSAASGRSSG
ncbi:MAG: hypothetical protein N838_03555 [Thiohalocapsa sp. PB-PSB1]|nr:MAG: hypothetical protein N838_03555 [Thiohalocapsa sp. PB-PSB1]